MSQEVSAQADKEARARALDVTKSFVCRAPAGSGKTQLLTQRVLACLATVKEPEEVLVITFTNKAVNEARTRLLGALERASDATPPEEEHERVLWSLARNVLARSESLGWRLEDNAARLRVVTIDRLNSELAGQLPLLSGLGGPASVDERPERLYQQAVHALFEEFEDTRLDEDTRAALQDLLVFADNRLDQLMPLLVAMLRTRDQWLPLVNQSDSLEMGRVLTALINDRLRHTYSAIGEDIRRRVIAILVSASGDELLHWAQSLSEWPSADVGALPAWRQLADALLTKTGELRRKVTKANGFPAREPQTLAMNALLGELQESMCSSVIAKALDEVSRLPDPEYPASLDAFRRAVTLVLVRLVAHLRLVFEANGRVDFTEVALRAINAVRPDDVVSDVLLRQDNIIRHILMDEGQDTNVSQYELLTHLTSGFQPDDGRTLFIVGDGQQSIYSFRQAEVGLFLKLWDEGHFNGVPLQRICLSANFRSDPVIVDWFNAAFATIFPAESDPYTSVVGFAPSTGILARGTNAGVEVHGFLDGDGRDEAAKVIDIIEQTKATCPDETIAVLVRTRSHLKHILPALKGASIDYSCRDIDPLANTPAVSHAISLTRAVWHPADRLHWVALLRAPFVGLSWADCHALIQGHLSTSIPARLQAVDTVAGLSPEGRERIARLQSALTAVDQDPVIRHSLPSKVEALWHLLGGPATIKPEEALHVETLFALLRGSCPGGELKSLEEFLGTLDGLYAPAPAGHEGSVEIMTIHAAKGLEFDTVILPSLGSKARRDEPPLLRHRNLPSGYLLAPNPGKVLGDSAATRLYQYVGSLEAQAKQNETLRLLYVGVTRAKRRLHLLGTTSASTDAGIGKPHTGSLLAALWPVVEGQFSQSQVADRQPSARAVSLVQPMSPRLRLDWVYPDVPAGFIPRFERAEMPSELAIHDRRDSGFEGANGTTERIVGTMYHALVARIAKEGKEGWDESKLFQAAVALRAGCRRLGMPEPNIEEGVEKVLRLVRTTLSCDVGCWLLARRPDAEQELKLAGYLNGRWVGADFDLTFKEDSTRWIIDYKTSGDGVPDHEVKAFVDAEVRTYTPQLARYSELWRAGSEDRVRCALYFPALPAGKRFVPVEVDERAIAA